jgi:hypothetical protein
MRAGLPVLRPKGVATPCLSCPKIPEGIPKTRDNAIELSERNWLAYQHYLECRAVGQFPKDPIVRRNARILRAIIDEAEQRPLWKLIALLGVGHGGRST